MAAALPVDSRSSSSEGSPAKPSLRQRLFSNTSRKSARQGKAAVEGMAIVANHPVEHSASTSITLNGEPPNTGEGLGPSDQATGSSDPPPNVASTMATSMQVDEPDREQGSVNTTLTGKHKRTLFYRRRANQSSASEGALSSSTTHSIIKPKPRSTRPKPSFLSRVVHKVVPCVNPDPDINGMDDDGPRTSEPGPSVPLREMTTVRENETHTSNITPAEQAAIVDDGIASLIVPPISIHPPPSPTDSEVIIPPPPSTHLLPEDETDGLTSGAVQPPGSTGEQHQIARSHTRDSSDDSDGTNYTDDEGDNHHIIDEQAEEERLIRNGGSGIPIGPDGIPRPLLPPILPQHAGRKCLVLDLDETLVHSSFKAVQQADFIVPVEIEYHWHHFHVLKRPGVDNFLKAMGEIYEVVIFTASLSKYADPVLDKLDIHQVVAHRLFRESCFSHKGNYVKDLSQLGRPIADTIILDNSPASYIFHPNNAAPVSSWFNDPHDAELTDLIPFLADLASVPDVRGILDGARS